RSFKQKVNRKMYEGAMRSIWSELIRQGRLFLVEDFNVEQPKTKELLQKLTALNLENALIVHHDVELNLLLAARNSYRVHVCHSSATNPAALLAFENVIITSEAMKQIEERLQ